MVFIELIMPIQILWGNDLNAQNTFIQKLIDKEVSKEWKEINVTNLNGDDDDEVNKAFDEVLTPPFGEGYRIVTLKNNPIFTAKNEDLRTKFEKIHDNIPQNTYFILQNTKKPDSRLKSTKFLQKLIKNNLAKEKSFSLPEIWDYEGQKRFLEDAANEMNIKIDKNAAEFYNENVIFTDPTQKTEGLDSYVKAQEKLVQRCDDVFLETHAISITGDCGFVEWTMGLKIMGKEFIYPGTTRLLFGKNGLIKEHSRLLSLLKASNHIVCDGPSLSVVENTLLKNRSQLMRLPQIICAKNYLSIETINQLKIDIGVIN